MSDNPYRPIYIEPVRRESRLSRFAAEATVVLRIAFEASLCLLVIIAAGALVASFSGNLSILGLVAGAFGFYCGLLMKWRHC